MPNIAPATLLKFLAQRQEDMLRDLKQYERPGGYDAHRSLRLAIREGVADGSLDGLHDALQRIPVTEERRRALKLEPVIRKRLSVEGDVFVKPPRGTWQTPGRQVSVDFHPDVGIRQGNHVLYGFIYLNKSVRPSPTACGAMLTAARTALGTALSEADEVAVFDIIAPRTSRAVPGMSGMLLEQTAGGLDSFFSKAR